MKVSRIALLPLLCGFSVSLSAAPQDLLQIYDLALASDPKLKQSAANLQAVGETDNQAIASLLPVLSITAGSSWNRIDNKKSSSTSTSPTSPASRDQVNASAITQGTGTQEYWDSSATFNLAQPVFHWDYWVALSQAENQIAQAEADYQAEKQDLMVRVADAYFNVLAAQDNLEYTRAEKDSLAKELDQAEQRFEVGLIPITDVYQTRASYDQAVASEISAANEVDSSKEQLREIIGDNDADLFGLGAEIPLKAPEPANIDTWSKMADAQNFSVISELNGAEIYRKNIELQRSGHYPKLDLTASVKQTDNNSSFGLRGDTESVGLTLTVPLFSGGSVYSKTQQAEYQYEQAKEKLLETRRSVNREVKDAYRDVLTSISSVGAYKSAVDSAEKALESTKAGYEVGTETMVDVLAATGDLYKAKRDYAQARYDYLVNGIKLKEAASILMPEDLEAANRLLKPYAAPAKAAALQAQQVRMDSHLQTGAFKE